MEDAINALPALSAMNPAYPGVIVLVLSIVMIAFRWRKNAGVISAPETLLSFGVAAYAASAATSAGGIWPAVVSGIGLAAVLAGAIGLRMQARGTSGKKLPEPMHRGSE